MLFTVKTNLLSSIDNERAEEITLNADKFITPSVLSDDGLAYNWYNDKSEQRHPNNKYCLVNGSFYVEELAWVLKEFNKSRILKRIAGVQLSVNPYVLCRQEYAKYDVKSDHLMLELYDPKSSYEAVFYKDRIDYQDIILPFLMGPDEYDIAEGCEDVAWQRHNNIMTGVFFTNVDYFHKVSARVYADFEVKDYIAMDIVVETYNNILELDTNKYLGSFDFTLYI